MLTLINRHFFLAIQIKGRVIHRIFILVIQIREFAPTDLRSPSTYGPTDNIVSQCFCPYNCRDNKLDIKLNKKGFVCISHASQSQTTLPLTRFHLTLLECRLVQSRGAQFPLYKRIVIHCRKSKGPSSYTSQAACAKTTY